MKKVLSLILTLSLVLSLTACNGGGQSSETPSPPETSTEQSPTEIEESGGDEDTGANDTSDTFVIGYNNMMSGAYPLDIMQWATEQAYAALDMQVMVFNDEANSDKSLSNIQNMIASGVDAISYQPVSDTMCLSLMEICENAGVPFIIRDAMPTDQEIYDTIIASPQFLGFVGTSNKIAGETMAELVIEAGYEKGIIIGIDRGQASQDARINGFWEMVEAKNINILGEARPAASSSEEMASQSEDLITANQESDFIYAAFGDVGCASADTCAMLGINPAIYVADITPTVLEYLADGDFVVAQGAHWMQATWEAAMVYNFLTGNQMLEDGKPIIYQDIQMITLVPEGIDLYQRLWLDSYAHSTDYVRSFTYDYNPDMSLEYFRDELINYSFDSVVKLKCEEGVITADEAVAAGVDVG